MTETFDYKFYLEHYPDLKRAGITTQESALTHWINHGKKEGRVCCKAKINSKSVVCTNKIQNLTKEISSENFYEIGADSNTDKISTHRYDRFYPKFIEYLKQMKNIAVFEIGMDQGCSLT